MGKRLKGKRVVVTQAESFMGPETVSLFEEEGALVFPDNRDLRERGACETLIKEVGDVDILIGNFASPSFSGVQVTDLSDEQLELPFEMMVYPLHRLTRAVLPQMIKRKRGQICLLYTSDAADE